MPLTTRSHSGRSKSMFWEMFVRTPAMGGATGRVAPGISARGSHRTVHNNLSLHGSCRSGHQTVGTVLTQIQWAKNLGRDFTTVSHCRWAFLRPRSLLYLSRDHRIR
jgi:hypothetical protein